MRAKWHGVGRMLVALVAVACSSDVLDEVERPDPMAQIGALVVLGDAISSHSDSEQYHHLLHARLEQRYGVPIAYANRAFGNSRASDLTLQIEDLPATLPGPVVVVITSGRNDMKAALPAILGMEDADERARLRHDLDVALDELLAPGRFGEGAQVQVYAANMFDPSDGEGDFAAFDCPFMGGIPPMPTDAAFAAWNDEIAAAVGEHDQALLDAHALFRGHGLDSDENWYDSNCAVPNAAGHAALAELFERVIAGDE